MRPPLAPLSFRGKLVTAGIAVQVVSMALLTWNSAYLIDNYLYSELRLRAERDAPMFNAAFAAPMLQRDYATVQAIARESRAKQGVAYIIVRDTAGRLVGQAGWPDNMPVPDAGLPQPVRIADGSLRFDFKAPLVLEGQRLGDLHYGLSGAFIEEARSHLVWRTVLVGLLILAGFSLLLAVLGHLLTRPLQRLTQASRQIRAGDYDVKLQAGSRDEIGVLTEDFRHMAAEIKRRVEALTQSEALQRRYLSELQSEHAALEAARANAEAANRAKSEFLAKMSHEIRTPMHGMLGMLDLMKADKLNHEQHERLDVVQRCGSALVRLVNDVLDFSKIESGKIELESIVFRPADIVTDAVRLFVPYATAKGIALIGETAADLPAALRGDPTRLRQVVGNLVSNAVKFTKHGSVAVRMLWAAPERLVIEVQDTGIGIAREALERIFESFTQADNSTTRRYGGSGLGLAISRQIVDLMAGELTVQSAPGKGSLFRVVLPASPAEQSARQQTAPARVAASRPSFRARVLLAEDNLDNQLLAQTLLGKLGCETHIANNGAEAVTLFSKKEFDIILMDCNMPEMDGYQATAAIRTLEADNGRVPQPRTPIVAVTANVMDGERERCAAVGMDDYLAKPFSMNDITAVMDKWAYARRV